MPIGLLSLHLEFPGCASLKEKRSRLKPLLSRLHREFNISTAEMGMQDRRDDPAHVQRSLQAVPSWVEQNWQDMVLIDEKLELI
ncbi:MAG: DUF503 domain-containing protein [Anaerolineales bacterium]|nr:DUF503 domain-containing protein [Anaerolineales bacterium]